MRPASRPRGFPACRDLAPLQQTESGWIRVPHPAEAPTPALGRVATIPQTPPGKIGVGYIWA